MQNIKIYNAHCGGEIGDVVIGLNIFDFNSPKEGSIALFKNGKLVHMLERHHIEGNSAELISENLKAAYNEFC